MKLYVDDVREVPEGWVLTRTITEAIRLLATMKVDEVSLDHDYLYNETYEPVARYIALMPKETRPKYYVHSSNPYAYNKYKQIN